VRVWETATGIELATFHDPGNQVHHLASAPDGQRLASALTDGLILVWDVQPLGWTEPRAAAALARLWADLGSETGETAFRAIWTLAACPDAVAFLRTRVKPIPPADPERVRFLIAELNHDDFDRRDKAAQKLADLGVRAESELRRKLATTTSAEVRSAL